MVVVDISDPDQPFVLRTYAGRGRPVDIVVDDDIAGFLYEDGLELVDVSTTPIMELLDTITPPGEGRRVFIDNHTVIVSTTEVLWVLDATVPADPVLVSVIDQLDSDERKSREIVATDSTILTTRMGLDSSTDEIVLYDRALVPAQSAVVACVDGLYGYSVAVADNKMYSNAGPLGVAVHRIANPDNPVLITHIDILGYASYLEVKDDVLYISDYNNDRLYIYDVSDPTNALLLSDSYVKDITDCELVGHFLKCNRSGMSTYTLDVSNPAAPQYQSPLAGSTVLYAVRDNIAYGASSETFYMFDLSQTTPPILGSFPIFEPLTAVKLLGNRALLISEEHTIILNVSDPAVPWTMGVIDIAATGDVIITGDRAYVFNREQIEVFDIVDPFTPLLVGRLAAVTPYQEMYYNNGSLVLTATVNSSSPYRGALILDTGVCSAACSPADVTTTGAPENDPAFGTPDGVVTGADIQFYVNAWLIADLSIADITTQNAPIGDPNHGVPDGLVTGADINYYVNLWIVGCP